MSVSEIPAESILEALDLSRAQPGIGFLEALFARFNAVVPFESASKIVRDARVEPVAEKPRRPEVFWNEHLESGSGGTCFARVAAFHALLGALGFSSRIVLGRVERDFDHAALLVTQDGRPWICDVGFPLPALLPAGEGRTDTPLKDLSVAASARGFRIDFLEGVPEGPQGLEIFNGELSPQALASRWEDTFAPGSPFLSKVVLQRCEAARIVSFARGEVRVDDRHSRLRLPSLPHARLAELFHVDADLLETAFGLRPDPPAAPSVARLTAYLESGVPPDDAFAAVSQPQTYRRLLEGLGTVRSQEQTPSGWRWVVAAPAPQGAAGEPEREVVEEIATDADRFAVAVSRRYGGPVFESEFRVEQRSGRTYLIREARFQSPREDLLRNDSLRGRLAGALAVDLLAWARLLA